MLQLQVSAALSRPWLGLDTKPARSFGYYCEDDEDELHRRVHDIVGREGAEMGDIGEHVSMVSRVGADDNVLVAADRHGNVLPTVIYDQVFNHAVNFGAQIVILDTLADIFDGNEIQRSVARKCITILRKLAVRIQGCVIVTAHPSLTGMNTGTGLSGSTGWNGAVRQRLYLTRVKPDNDEEEQSDERVLKTMKNNYGPDGGRIRLKWERGVFVRVDGQGRPSGLIDRLDADRKIMDAMRSLVANGTLVLASSNQPASFANLLRTVPDLKGLSFGYMTGAQDRFLEQGKLIRVELGPPSKRRVYLRPADMLYPGEMTGVTE